MQGQLAALQPAYETAVGLQNRLAEIQKRMGSVRASAELCTYLRHPWPRTQLLSALLRPLPEEIAFLQVQIFRQPATGRPPTEFQPPADKKAEEEKLKSLPAAGRDLAALRARLDPLQTVVVLGGTATESALLHGYLGALDATDVFDKAELDCFNRVDNSKGGAALQFRAVLAVEPGYGQPGGPAGPPTKPRPVVAPGASTGATPGATTGRGFVFEGKTP
jgi:hypothetical protein